MSTKKFESNLKAISNDPEAKVKLSVFVLLLKIHSTLFSKKHTEYGSSNSTDTKSKLKIR